MNLIYPIFSFFLITLSYNTPKFSCEGYAALNKGTKFTLTSYEKGNTSKSNGSSSYEVIQSNANGATIHLITHDAKGKDISVNFDIHCNSTGIIIDQKTILQKELEKSITNPEIHSVVTGNNLEIPSNLSVGLKLPDSKIDVKITSGKVNLSVKTEVYNREVIGNEKITVPAGTFDCYIISYETNVKSLITKKSTHKSWVAKGIGTVKQETYDKKGGLEKLELLTSLTK